MADTGAALGGAAQGAAAGSAFGPWGAAIGGGVGLLGGLFGSKSGSATSKIAQSPYEGSIQKYLPFALRYRSVDPYLGAGVAGIGNLIQNPGTLSPNVAEAIAPRLAMESQNIAQNYRGLQSQQAGAAARGNVPVSIRTALDSALGVAQERAQRQARQAALAESGQLERQDLSQIYPLLDAILQYMSSGRGQSIQGLASAGRMESETKGSQLSALGSIASALASTQRPGGSTPYTNPATGNPGWGV